MVNKTVNEMNKKNQQLKLNISKTKHLGFPGSNNKEEGHKDTFCI